MCFLSVAYRPPLLRTLWPLISYLTRDYSSIRISLGNRVEPLWAWAGLWEMGPCPIMLRAKSFRMRTYERHSELLILKDLVQLLSPLECAVTKNPRGVGRLWLTTIPHPEGCDATVLVRVNRLGNRSGILRQPTIKGPVSAQRFSLRPLANGFPLPSDHFAVESSGSRCERLCKASGGWCESSAHFGCNH